MVVIKPQSEDDLTEATAEPTTLGAMILDAAGRRSGSALRYRRDAREMSVSYAELGAQVTDIARGLIALGIAPGDRVAIFGATSPEWTLADYGALCAAAVVVPIYHTSSAPECGYVLAHSAARVVFCGDAEQAARVAAVRAQCPALEHVIALGEPIEGAISVEELGRRGVSVGAGAVRDRLAAIGPGEPATLVYTSGTTGPPKGCMLSHANVLATARMYVDELGIREEHALYQFLPLAHVLARVAQTVILSAGATICFWGGDPAGIIDDLGAMTPTHFPAVPRIYEKVHGTVIGRIQDGSAPVRALFGWAIRQGTQVREATRAGHAPGPWQTARYRLADRLVLSRVRDVFGERLQIALVGAAVVAPELLRFFDACGVLILEGYGLTESCAVATLNTPRALRFGTVGRPLPGTEVSIAPDGEILIRGPQIFQGYYRDPEATAAALTPDRWLRTGDLGAITPDGFVAITGRKKDLIITSSGKNISPVNIESVLREQRCITEAVVFGDGRPYLVALLTLDREETAKLARRLGVPAEPTTWARDPQIRAELQREVDAVNVTVSRIEQIKRFAILDGDLSHERGELTPTLKVKRASVYARYAGVFADLYEDRGLS